VRARAGLRAATSRGARIAMTAALCAVAAGCSQLSAARQDPPRDLAALCDTRPENHQFDFWLGNWDVYDKEERVAESTIQRLPGSCAILESYSQPDGYSGKSINFFDSRLTKWRQTWVDKVGTVSEFTGEFVEGAMRLEGETHTRDGKVILRKMTVSAIDSSRVRQYSERSSDRGNSWSTAYDFTYRRRQ
jgi:hypothetical protein